MRSGLTTRTVIASLLLALTIAGIFGLLAYDTDKLQKTRQAATEVRLLADASKEIYTDIGDLEAEGRAYQFTGRKEFLLELGDAQRQYKTDTAKLIKLVQENSSGDLSHIKDLIAKFDSYNKELTDLYAEREVGSRGSSTDLISPAKEREFEAARDQLRLYYERKDHVLAQKRRLVASQVSSSGLISVLGILLSIIEIFLFAVFIRRRVIKPVAAVAEATELVSQGDLSVRLPDSGSGEVRKLSRAFNQMVFDLHKLRQSDDRFWSNSLEHLAVCDFNAYFTRLNPIWEETLGYSIEELCSKPAFEFVHPDDRAPTEAAAQRLFDEGLDVVNFENRYRCADGSYRWLQWASTVDMELELSFGVARDITERKNNERVDRIRLAVSQILAVASSIEQAVEGILKAIGDELNSPSRAYWEMDDNRELKCSYAWRDTGKVTEEFEQATKQAKLNLSGPLVGKAWTTGKAVHLKDISNMNLVRGEVAEHVGLQSALAIPIVTSKKHYGVFEFFFFSTEQDAGELLRGVETVIGLIEQYFDRKAAELENERLKDEFFALVSHELRTPLTSIIGYLELLEEAEDERISEQGKSFLKTINRSAERLIRLVSDILLAAKFEAGNLRLELSKISLNDIISGAIRAAEPVASSRNIELSFSDPGTEVKLCGDKDRIGQALDNLLSNALKFTSASGSVKVTLAVNGNEAEINVTDTGEGIPEDEQAKLFDRFFRARKAVDNAVPGAGLGLTITKGIIEAHGGAIGVTSKPGVGTTFTVKLPLREVSEWER